MKLGMILGLVGGVVALLLGLVTAVVGAAVGGAASQLGASGVATSSGLLVLGSLGLPILALVGAALIYKNIQLAVLCLVASGGGLFFFGAFTLSSWLIAGVGAVIGLGAVLAKMDHENKEHQMTYGGGDEV